MFKKSQVPMSMVTSLIAHSLLLTLVTVDLNPRPIKPPSGRIVLRDVKIKEETPASQPPIPKLRPEKKPKPVKPSVPKPKPKPETTKPNEPKRLPAPQERPPTREQSAVRNPKSEIRNPKSEIRNPKSEIRNPLPELPLARIEKPDSTPRAMGPDTRQPRPQIPRPSTPSPDSRPQVAATSPQPGERSPGAGPLGDHLRPLQVAQNRPGGSTGHQRTKASARPAQGPVTAPEEWTQPGSSPRKSADYETGPGGGSTGPRPTPSARSGGADFAKTAGPGIQARQPAAGPDRSSATAGGEGGFLQALRRGVFGSGRSQTPGLAGGGHGKKAAGGGPPTQGIGPPSENPGGKIGGVGPGPGAIVDRTGGRRAGTGFGSAGRAAGVGSEAGTGGPGVGTGVGSGDEVGPGRGGGGGGGLLNALKGLFGRGTGSGGGEGVGGTTRGRGKASAGGGGSAGESSIGAGRPGAGGGGTGPGGGPGGAGGGSGGGLGRGQGAGRGTGEGGPRSSTPGRGYGGTGGEGTGGAPTVEGPSREGGGQGSGRGRGAGSGSGAGWGGGIGDGVGTGQGARPGGTWLGQGTGGSGGKKGTGGGGKASARGQAAGGGGPESIGRKGPAGGGGGSDEGGLGSGGGPGGPRTGQELGRAKAETGEGPTVVLEVEQSIAQAQASGRLKGTELQAVQDYAARLRAGKTPRTVAKARTGGVFGRVSGTFRMPVVRLSDYDDPQNIPNLLAEVSGRTQIKVSHAPGFAPLQLASIEETPLIYFTGHKSFKFTAAQRETLRQYVELGGTILGETDHGPFSGSFQREIRQVFGQSLRPIPLSDPLFKAHYVFDEVPCGDLLENKPLMGIKQNGRWAVIFSPNDYGDCWANRLPFVPQAMRADVRENAFRLGVNIFVYAVAHWNDIQEKRRRSETLKPKPTTQVSPPKAGLPAPQKEKPETSETAPKSETPQPYPNAEPPGLSVAR